MEEIIKKALKNTSSGNWAIELEELETLKINLKEFCKYLDNDDRVCEYELTDDGIDMLFWLDYCEFYNGEGED